MNLDTKEQSNDARTFTKEVENFKQTSACQKSYGNYFVGQEGSADSRIRITRDHNNVKSVLGNTSATCSRWFLARGFFCPEDGDEVRPPKRRFFTRSTRRHIPEDGILHSHCR
jgi:hypothetical protein